VLWILIRIDLVVLDPDPDPYWDADSYKNSTFCDFKA
jgi:hypothetical protein